MRYQLICSQGSLAGQIVVLDKETISFGRQAGTTFTIANTRASQRHAELGYENGSYVLRDFQTHTGTFVNGNRIASQMLRAGDLVEIGGEQFRFEELSNDSTLNVPVRIVVMNGMSVGQIYPLGNNKLTFGRHTDNIVKIPNKIASRHHAEVCYEGGRYILNDLQSQNGTFVNGDRISSHTLTTGDVIGIGNQQFRFEVAEHHQRENSVPVRRSWEPLQVMMDFQLQGSGIQIAWHAPILGERRTRFTFPYKPAELPVVIRALDAVQYPDYPHYGPQFSDEERTTLMRLDLWHNHRVVGDIGRRVGQRLYSALGADGRTALEIVRNYSIAERRPISYVLRFPERATALSALPWELIADEHSALLIGRRTHVDSCERYILTERAVRPNERLGRPPHILALSPAYEMSHQLRHTERAARLATWERLRAAGKLSFDELSPVTPRRLREYLQRTQQPPDIVHYFGHGTYRDGEGGLYIDNDEGGTTLINTAQLVALLGDVKLIVLYACGSSQVGPSDSLITGIAPALSLVADAVVGMQMTMRSAAAVSFSEVFYETLLNRHRSLQESVAEGRQALFVEEQDSASWYVPVLYIRAREQHPIYFSV
jgi:pSer/pThr/pTyr-binding forkhead associated (FHA) protein